MSCPQTMILQISRSFKLLRWRARDKSPITLSGLNTCNRVKTANPEYKNTQQDLTGGNFHFRLSRICKLSRISRLLNCRFLSNSAKEGGVLCQKLSNYSLLVSGSLLSGFKIPTVIPSIYLCSFICKLNKKINK